MRKRMKCKCLDWQEYAEQLSDQAVFCSNQIAGPKYTGKQFSYCPWCGGLLMSAELGQSDTLIPLEYNASCENGHHIWIWGNGHPDMRNTTGMSNSLLLCCCGKLGWEEINSMG